MDLRHLDTVRAIADEGSFTGAADALVTVQSNVSEQVRQLEEELGAQLFVRGRRGAVATECGEIVVERARRIRRELEAMQADLSMLQGLEAGEASFGIVGTASRWVVPPLIAELRIRAPGVRMRITEAASERLVLGLLAGELVHAVVTEPITDRRLVAETILEEELVAVFPRGAGPTSSPVALEAVLAFGLVVPPVGNPLRQEVETVAAERHCEVNVMVEVDGIRLLADLVAAGAGASIVPETALPHDAPDIDVVRISDMPPRRLALVTARDARLSLADRAVRIALLDVVAGRRPSGAVAFVSR
jgi:DNA-binding transcriptional LysR family regulator